MRPSSSFTATAAIVTTLTLSLSGCGGQAGPLGAAKGAASRTLKQRATTSFTLIGATAFGPSDKPVVGRGVFAFPEQLGYSVVALPASGSRPPAPAYLVFLPATVYLMPAAGASRLGNGKSWVSVPLASPSPFRTAFPRLAAQIQGLNPGLLLNEIVWGGTAATRVGSEVISHIPLTKYVVRVDLARALSAAKGPAAQTMRLAIQEQAAAESRGHAPATVPISIWVNGSGLVARLQTSVAGSGLGTSSIALTGFGASFRKSVPPRTQIASITVIPASARSPLAPWILVG